MRAREFQKLLDDGVVNSRAELAKRYGMSRARITQVMNLLRLPASIQKRVVGAGEDEGTPTWSGS